jgi:hypothetical protein
MGIKGLHREIVKKTPSHFITNLVIALPEVYACRLMRSLSRRADYLRSVWQDAITPISLTASLATSETFQAIPCSGRINHQAEPQLAKPNSDEKQTQPSPASDRAVGSSVSC